MFLRESERRSNGICRYSVSLITEGACKASRCECNMWPLCSSMRATPLKIITTARRSVHTLMGSKEAFSTKTRAFMAEADITRARRKVSKISVGRERSHVCLRATGHLCRCFEKLCEPDAREPPAGMSALLPKAIRRLNQGAQISRLHNGMAGIRRDV